MARPRNERPQTASEQLEALLGKPWPFKGRPPKHDLSTWIVTEDWPECISVTEAELDVFEAWFGDIRHANELPSVVELERLVLRRPDDAC